ncbi:MAG: hypothetical protein WC701_02165 [Kiritimatiellales bacterium]|jgi:hypothetical protein
MKRMVAILIAGAAFSAASYAQTNTVSSANVVGYIQVVDPASNRLVLISAPFNSGTGTVSTLLDIFGTNQLRQSFLPTRCDQVITWDVVQQRYVRYVQKTNSLFYFSTNFTGSAVNPTITRGQALWLQAPAAAYAPTSRVIYISGDVPNDSSYTNSIAGNAGNPLSFIANPYPVEVNINSLINTNDGAKGSFLPTRADKIMIWDSSAQQYVRLALKTPANKWYYSTNFSAVVEPVIIIQPGQGFWYQTTNAFNWVEAKTYTLE